MALYYRLRNTKRAIEELEGQYFYFSRPDKLNDPMEWYVNMFWSGDIVVWKNLFRHYLLCLDFCMIQYRLNLPVKNVYEFVLSIHKSAYFESRQKFLDSVIDKIFSDDDFLYLIHNIALRSTKVYDYELRFYLDTFKDFAISTLIDMYNSAKPHPSQESVLLARFRKTCEALKKNNYFETINRDDSNTVPMNKQAHSVFIGMDAINEFSVMSLYDDADALEHRINISLTTFSNQYIKAIKQLLFPNWSIVSFMREVTNPVVWGHYADGHRGVCMIFESNGIGSEEWVQVWKPVSYAAGGGYTYEYRNLAIQDVNYVTDLPEIDFFLNIGMVTLPQLMESWYTFKGETSHFADSVNAGNRTSRHHEQWDAFRQKTLSKLRAWDYEHESRLIYTDLFKPLEDDERKVKFHISHLKGVILGLDTALTDKLRIRKVLQEKCNNENLLPIKIYQAFYDHQTSTIKHFATPSAA